MPLCDIENSNTFSRQSDSSTKSNTPQHDHDDGYQTSIPPVDCILDQTEIVADNHLSDHDPLGLDSFFENWGCLAMRTRQLGLRN